MTIASIVKQMKKNARNNLKNQFLRNVIEIEAALWILIAFAWILKILR
jgi:hypothetical protein